MNAKSISIAVREAKDFLKAASIVALELHEEPNGFFVCSGKSTGALRRASMDLTRALAEMRKAS